MGNKTEKAKFIESLVLIAFVVTNLISNVIAGKVLLLPGGLSVAGATICCVPLINFLDDLNTNCLGYQSAKRMTWISIIANIFMSLIFALIVVWPSSLGAEVDAAYKIVLGQSIRVVVASICAFFVSSFVNSYIVQKMKAHQVDKGLTTMNKKHIFYRTFGSSIPSVLLDSIIFNAIAFIGVVPFNVLLSMMLMQWLLKLAVELILQPILVNFIPWFSRTTGLDVIDRDGFNPFKFKTEENTSSVLLNS